MKYKELTKEQLENLVNDFFKSYDERYKPESKLIKFVSEKEYEEFNKALREEYKKTIKTK